MKTKLLLFLLLVTSVAKVSSQQSFVKGSPDFLNITTPNVASFNKFIDNPISLYNGTPDVSIPIYTIKDGSIELPIVLRYNTSGIKVDEEASWVGLGWNLNVGGVITQNAIGGYDDADSDYATILSQMGLNWFNFSMPYQSIPCTPESYSNLRPYLLFGEYTGKFNPDVFYFTYPGGAGKFIIDYRNDSIYILNKEQDIKIEKIRGTQSLDHNRLIEFKMTTPEGIVHRFKKYYDYSSTALYDTYDMTDTQTYQPLSIHFLLTESTYPDGSVVSYRYNAVPIRKFSQNYYAHFPVQASSHIMSGTLDTDYTRSIIAATEFYLEWIDTPNYTVGFNTTDANDFRNAQKLDFIHILNSSSGNSNVLLYVFDYDYFIGKSDTWTSGTGVPAVDSPEFPWNALYGTHRLKLNGVYQLHGSEKINEYRFTYNTTQLPNKYSYSADYWGYYNGETGKSGLPDMERFLWVQLPYLPPEEQDIFNIGRYGYSPYAMNKGYNFTYCQAGILTGIEYPTKGYTEFTYEPNTFQGNYIPKAQDILFDEVQIADAYDPNVTYQTAFTLTAADDRVPLEIRIGKGDQAHEWWHLQNSEVIVFQNTGTSSQQVFYYLAGNDVNNPPADNTGTLTSNWHLSLAAGNYTLRINVKKYNPSPNDVRSGQVSAKLMLKRTFPSSAENQGCGLRIQFIRSYADILKQNLLLNTVYNYNNPTTGKSSGILHDVLRYYNFHRAKTGVIRYTYSNGACVLPAIPVAELYDVLIADVGSSNKLNNPYGTIGGVGYTYVKEMKIGAGSFSGHTVYQFDNQPPTGQAQGSFRIDDPLNGSLQSIRYYESNNDLPIKTEQRFYHNRKLHSYFGLNITNMLNMFPGMFPSSILNGDRCPTILCDYSPTPYNLPQAYQWRFQILAHQLSSYRTQLDSVVVTENEVAVKEKYTYHPTTLQLTSKKILQSDNTLLEYRYFYPNDYNFSPYTEMTTSHILSPVIEEKIYNNTKYIGGHLTKYMNITQGDKTLYVPDKKYFSVLAVPSASDPSTFTSEGENTTIYPFANMVYGNYTQYGKPQSMIYNDAEKVVYLWGYNYQYPIAEIKNATYSEVESAVQSIFSVAGMDALSALATPNETKLKDGSLQKALSHALVTTYTYKPMVGILTSTDPRGVTTTGEYDPFGRLQTIKDENNKVLENYEYHYKN
jgi:YD repeat-containing protein